MHTYEWRVRERTQIARKFFVVEDDSRGAGSFAYGETAACCDDPDRVISGRPTIERPWPIGDPDLLWACPKAGKSFHVRVTGYEIEARVPTSD